MDTSSLAQDFQKIETKNENAKINFKKISICYEILVDEDYIDEDYLFDNCSEVSFSNILPSDNYYLFLKQRVDSHKIPEINEEFLQNFGYCNLTHSYETDLFSYKYQNSPPYYTKFYRKKAIEVEFADKTYFISEGRKVQLINEKLRKNKMTCIASYTYFFNSKIRVWHIVITPQINEWITETEVIKAMKLFSGAQEKGMKSDLEFSNINYLNFILGGKESKKLTDLFEYVTGIKYKFKESAPEKDFEKLLKSGIVSIDLSNNTYPKFKSKIIKDGSNIINEIKAKKYIDKKLKETFNIIFQNIKKTNITDLKSDKGYLEYVLNSFCGITLGIFDYERMSIEEITDTLNPLEKSIKSTSFLTINRGVISSYSLDDDTLNSSINKQGISPYLIIPSAVLSHNDYVSRDAENRINSIWNDLNSKKRINIKVLINGRDEIDDLINDDVLPNVFQYPTEQEIYNYGMAHRGIKERVDEVRAKLIQLDKIIDSKQTKQSLDNEKWIQGILTFLSILQIISVFADFNSFWGDNHGPIKKESLRVLSIILSLLWLAIIFLMLRKNSSNVDRLKSQNKIKKLWKKITESMSLKTN